MCLQYLPLSAKIAIFLIMVLSNSVQSGSVFPDVTIAYANRASCYNIGLDWTGNASRPSHLQKTPRWSMQGSTSRLRELIRTRSKAPSLSQQAVLSLIRKTRERHLLAGQLSQEANYLCVKNLESGSGYNWASGRSLR